MQKLNRRDSVSSLSAKRGLVATDSLQSAAIGQTKVGDVKITMGGRTIKMGILSFPEAPFSGDSVMVNFQIASRPERGRYHLRIPSAQLTAILELNQSGQLKVSASKGEATVRGQFMASGIGAVQGTLVSLGTGGATETGEVQAMMGPAAAGVAMLAIVAVVAVVAIVAGAGGGSVAVTATSEAGSVSGEVNIGEGGGEGGGEGVGEGGGEGGGE